jgi:sulfur-carrier protein
MVKILYFARIKESLNYSTEEIALPSDVSTIAHLKDFLARRGDTWSTLFSGNQPVRAAINHALVDNTAVISDGDEIGFFPPVTGG